MAPGRAPPTGHATFRPFGLLLLVEPAREVSIMGASTLCRSSCSRLHVLDGFISCLVVLYIYIFLLEEYMVYLMVWFVCASC